jgi:hypothetical protein
MVGWMILACQELAHSEWVPNGLRVIFIVKLFRSSVAFSFQPLFHTV